MTIIGGRSQSCIGEHRRKLPQNIWPDLALFSRNGWDLPRGISAQTEEKAALKNDLIVNAKRRGRWRTAVKMVRGRGLTWRIPIR